MTLLFRVILDDEFERLVRGNEGVSRGKNRVVRRNAWKKCRLYLAGEILLHVHVEGITLRQTERRLLLLLSRQRVLRLEL